MTDIQNLKAIAERCKQHQPLRFMHSQGALYIRNDNGIVFDVHQNRSFPDFMAENKDYADLILAANPAAVLELIAELESANARLHEVAVTCATAEQERDALKLDNEILRGELGECCESLHGKMLQKFGGQQPDDMHPVTRRAYDRDMAEIACYRAVLIKESAQ